MIGELGAFFLDGRQIGGILSWELDFGKQFKSTGLTREKFSVRKVEQKDWRATAQGWWLLEPFSPERSYLVRLYTEFAIYEGRAVLKGIKEVLQELVSSQLLIRGRDALEIKIGRE